MTVEKASRPVLITTCFGRLEHLKQTLPTWLERTHYHVLVASYRNCPDRSLSWVSSLSNARVAGFEPGVAFGLGEAQPIFNKPYLLNAALIEAEARGAVRVVMIDADTRVTGDISAVEHDGMCIVQPDKATAGLTGFLAADAAAIARAGRYDHLMTGYGAEDLCLRARLYLRTSPSIVLLHPSTLRSIEHDDEARTRYYEEKDPRRSAHENLCRMMAGLTELEIETLKASPALIRDLLLAPGADRWS